MISLLAVGVVVLGAVVVLSPVDAGASNPTAITGLSVVPSSTASKAVSTWNVGFTTSSSGALAAGSGTVTVALPSTVSLGSFDGGIVTDTTAGQQVGNSCNISTGTTLSCSLFAPTAASHVLSVALDGVTNPSATGSVTTSVSTSSHTVPVTKSVTITAKQAISALTVVPASSAANALTTWNVGFTTSSTGALSADGSSTITVNLPTTVGLGSFNGGTVTDTTSGQPLSSNCTVTTGTTIVCSIYTATTAGDVLAVALNGVTNPSATGSVTTSVSTSSDLNVVTKTATITAAQAVTGLSVVPTTTAAGATATYTVGFTTKDALTLGAGDSISIAFPASDGLSAVGGSITDTTTGYTVANCSLSTGSTAVCPLNYYTNFYSGVIAAGDVLSASITGVTNSTTTGAGTFSVSTSSDTVPVTKSVTITAKQAISALTVVPASSAANALTTWNVGFTTSSTGALSADGSSTITVNLPTTVGLGSFNGGTVTDTTSGQPLSSNCTVTTGTTIVCSIYTATTAGDVLAVALNGVTNPSATGSVTTSVSTSSDLNVVTKTATITAAQAVTGLSVVPTTTAAGATATYTVGFTTKDALTLGAGDSISIAFPASDGLSAVGGSITDTTTGYTVANCSLSTGSTAVCPLNYYTNFYSGVIAAGDVLSASITGVTNSTTTGAGTFSVSTSSDTVPVTKSVTITAKQAISALTVVPASSAANALTTWNVGFTTSSTGALSADGSSTITVNLPTTVGLGSFNGGTVTDTTSGQPLSSNCTVTTGTTIVCSIYTATTAGDVLAVALNGVTNPSATGSVTTSVSTSSDLNVVTKTATITAAQAVTGLSVVPTTTAAGATATYTVGFTTKDALTWDSGDAVDVTFPSGDSVASTNGYLTDTTTGQTLAYCDQLTGSTVSCQLDNYEYFEESTTPGDILSISLGDVTNSTATGAGTFSVSTSSDTVPVTKSVTITAKQAISALTVVPASSAANALTTWNVGFATSSTGALSADGSSTITVNLPTTVGLGSFNGGTVTDTTSGQPLSSNCTVTTGTTIVCSIYTATTAGDVLAVALNGVTNPSATGSVTTSVSTSSDLTVVTASTTIGTLHALSNVTVTPTSTAVGALATYTVGFTTSSTGALTQGSNSAVTVVLPTGSTFASYAGGSVTDTTTSQQVGSCTPSSGTTVTCGISTSTHAGDVLSVVLNGIANPTTTGVATVSVSTSTDSTPVAKSVTFVADQSVANLSVVPASTTSGVTGTWNVSLTSSSSGGLSGSAGSTITLVLPSTVGLGSFSGGSVTDTTSSRSVGNGCKITTGTTVVCSLDGTANAGDALLVSLEGVTNPSTTGSVSTTVSTTSDTVAGSKTTTITTAQSVTGLTVAPSSTATGATVSDTVGFTASSTGALSRTPNGTVTITLPTGTGLGSFQNGSLSDSTNGDYVGSCSPSTGTSVVCLVQSSDVASGDALSATLNGVTNPTTAGSYTVSVTTSSDTKSAVSPALSIVTVTADAGDPVVTTVGTAVAFNGSGSQPSVGIQSYGWNFGDGSSTATGEQVTHGYATAGTYSATLTVSVGTAIATDSVQVTVDPAPVQAGGLVTVTDASSHPLSGATVAIIAANGDKYAGTTTASGVATLNDLPDGPYTVYAWTSGYLPNTGSITIASGDGSATVVLQSGSVAQTSLTSTPLTAQQVAAAGIDPNNPANQNVFQFEIHLAFFGSTTVDFSGYTASGSDGVLEPSFDGSGGGEIADCDCWAVSGTGEYIYPVVQYDSGEPTILWMIIPGEAQWLKEFFSIQMVVTNLASSSFTLTNGQATLGDLPDGLSLAPTGTPQSLSEALPNIPGGGSAQAQWIIRGDTEGFYGLNAQYTGTLQPLGATVTLPAATVANAIHVWGGSALTMTVDADNQAVTGNPYLVRIGLTNNADVPIYNPDVQLLTTDARLNYIYQPDEQLTQGTDVIEPGATYWTNYYRLVSEITGNLQTDLSFVKMTAGNSDLTYSIISHPAATSVPSLSGVVQGNGVQLTWTAPSVSGITGYQVFYTPTRDTLFGPTPVATLPASATSAFISNGPSGFYALSTVTASGLTMYNNLAEVSGTATGPTLSLAPATLAGSGSTTVSGSGFAIGKAKVSIYLDTTSSKALTSLKVSATGTISKALKLTGLTGGNHQIIAVQVGEVNASAALGVTPVMTIKPTSAKPGASVKATLTAFETGESVVFHWGSTTGAPVGSSTVSATGAGTGTVAVPSTAPAGTYLVYAVGNAGTTVSASLKVK